MSDSGRQRQIVELLRDRPFASVRELQERLGVSAATVRRDIDKMHKDTNTEWFGWYFDQGLMSWDETRRQLELFATKVMPEFKD